MGRLVEQHGRSGFIHDRRWIGVLADTRQVVFDPELGECECVSLIVGVRALDLGDGEGLDVSGGGVPSADRDFQCH